MRDRRARWALAGMAAATLVTACAFNRPSEDEANPETGAPPPGISSQPATPAVGPTTNPMPMGENLAPRPDRSPMGTMSAEGGATGVQMDSTTRALSGKLDSILVASDAGLTRMSPAVALGLIGGIQRFLESRQDPRLRPVVTELEALRAELSRSPIDGRATGVVLQRLGRRTAEVAPAAGVLAGREARLADGLSETGAKLAQAR